MKNSWRTLPVHLDPYTSEKLPDRTPKAVHQKISAPIPLPRTKKFGTFGIPERRNAVETLKRTFKAVFTDDDGDHTIEVDAIA